MLVQDAKKKDSKPQPSENELLRAAMVSIPTSWLAALTSEMYSSQSLSEVDMH